MVDTERRPVRAEKEEFKDLEQMHKALEGYMADRSKDPAVLMDGDVRIEIPPSLFAILCDAVGVLLDGGAVAIMPYHHELTTQDAADYLGVSRPHLISLLDKESIPYHFTGTHRRMRLGDIEEYRKRRDANRRAVLDELTRDAYELGLYNAPPDKRI